jgi:aryl-alcohol dehydrogenase-like predicted oxidoreductase
VTLDQLRTAQSIVDIAAVTAHYNVAVRTGADLLRAAEDAGMAFSPWHPVTLTEGPDSAGVMAVVEPIASRHGVTPRQVALAWHPHRSPASLPIPGTTSVGHLKDNLAAGKIELSGDDTAAITALVAEQ